MWDIVIIVRISGNMKCKEKNRVNVALFTEKPPQSHCVICGPIYGIADKRLVITVAPQNDICPQGSTYPIKAVAINVIIIKFPEFHVDFMKKEEYIIPRPI